MQQSFLNREKHRWPPSRRNRLRAGAWKLTMGLLASAMVCAAWAQAGRITTGPGPEVTPAIPGGTFEGRPVATELTPELKRLIDAVKRLHLEPGLILDREAIYKTMDVRPDNLRTSLGNDGARGMGESLVPNKSPAQATWGTELYYSEFPKTNRWSVRVLIGDPGYKRAPACYPSRLVEAYWGQPFVYQRSSVYTPHEAGAHDGWPNKPGFDSPFPNSATVIFTIGWGGCLGSIQASKIVDFKEYSNDHIYHE